MSHTPGDWLLDFDRDGSFTIHVGDLCHPDLFVVCSRNPVHHRPAESLANARLLVASPRLLKALKALASACSANHWDWMGRGVAAHLIADALDAIREAEGGEP